MKKVSLSVQFSHIISDSATPWTAAGQAFLSITNSQSLLKLISSSQWCHPAISFSVVPFSSCLQSFPASGPFPMSQFFVSGGHAPTLCSQRRARTAQPKINKIIFFKKLTLRYTDIGIQMKDVWKSLSRDTLWTHGLYSPWNPPGRDNGVGSLSLL